MKKVLSIILTIALVLGSFSVTYAEPAVTVAGSFSDLGQEWYTDAIQNAVSNGLITGYQDGTVRPNGNLTRAELATIINRAFGATKQGSLSGIKDVAAGDWYAVEMAKAIQMETFKGGTDGKMRPGDPITRQEAFAVVARAYKLSSQEYGKLNQYADAASVDTWAKAEIAALINEGYIKGNDNRLEPKSKITRAEFATILGNLTKQYIKTAGTVTSVAERGNVLVNVDGVTLKNVTVNGDLIVGDGVGEGNLYLDNVKITGRTLVRGGGVNSVIIVGQAADVGKVIIAKVDGAVRVKAEGGAVIETIVIDDGKDDVIIEGTVGTVEVAAANVPVVIQNATITMVNVVAEKADVTIAKDTTVNTVTVAPTAADTSLAVAGTVATVTTQSSNTEIAVTGTVTKVEATATAQAPAISVAQGAKIENVVTAAPETKVSGQGTVTKVEAQAGANGSSITTPNTKTTVAEGVTGATGGGGAAIESGTTATNNATGTGSSETPATTGGGGGNNGPTTIAVTGITLNTATLILEINTPGAITTTGTITATVSPGNASNKNVTWSSNNTSIAAVDANGNVTAGTTTGTAIITATTLDGSKTATCAATVAKDWSELADTDWYTVSESAIEYMISTAEELAGLAMLVNRDTSPVSFESKTIKLANNINLLNIKWIPIGNGKRSGYTVEGNSFQGTLNGNGKVISNLRIVANDNISGIINEYAYGLIGSMTKGSVKSLTIDNPNIAGTGYSNGAFVGFISYGYDTTSSDAIIIQDCIVSGGSIQGHEATGGIIGRLVGSKSSGDIETELRIKVLNCENKGTAVDVTSLHAAGGIVGNQYRTNQVDQVVIEDCRNSGNVTSPHMAGGIAGQIANGTLDGGANTGSITGGYTAPEGYFNAGQLIGYSTGAKIINVNELFDLKNVLETNGGMPIIIELGGSITANGYKGEKSSGAAINENSITMKNARFLDFTTNTALTVASGITLNLYTGNNNTVRGVSGASLTLTGDGFVNVGNNTSVNLKHFYTDQAGSTVAADVSGNVIKGTYAWHQKTEVNANRNQEIWVLKP